MKLPALLVAAWTLSAFTACSDPPARGRDGAAGAAAGTGATGDGAAGTHAAAGAGGNAPDAGVDRGSGPAGMGMMMMMMQPAGMGAPPPDAADPDVVADAGAPPEISCPTETRDGGADAPAGCRVSTVPSKGCTIAKTAIVPSVLCAGSATCPVTAEARLSCTLGLSNARISLAPRADGASVIADVTDVDDGTSEFDTQLFTISTTGTSRVEYFRDVLNGLLAADRAGGRHFFTGSSDGGWHLRETAGAWLREDFKANPPLCGATVVAQVVDDAHATVALASADGLSLGTRDQNGWRFSPVPGLTPFKGLALDVGDDGKAWLATVGVHGNDFDHVFLDVVSPDRTHETLLTLLEMESSVVSFVPAILAGGLSGHDARPAIAYRRDDGIHIATPAAGTAWSHRLVPGTADLAVTSNACPPADGQLLNCGIPTCDESLEGSGMGMALARTPSGAFLVWLDIKATRVHKLLRDPTCGIGAQGCICRTGEVVERRGAPALVVARVPADPAAALAVQRFTLSDGTDGAGMIALSTRGTTLLAAVTVRDFPTEIRYLEIDATKLP